MVFAPSIHPHISQLWTNFEPTTSVWASVPSQAHRAKILKSTFKVSWSFRFGRTKLKTTSHWYWDPQTCPVCTITEQSAISETFPALCNLQLQPQKHQKPNLNSGIMQFSEQRSVFAFLLRAHPSTSQPQADIRGKKKIL